jgi:DNA invertase Pin-like site-specific DNA recombinase
MRVLGYIRVSTSEQVSGASLEAQRQAITAEAERRGWELVAVLADEGASGKDLKRPGLQEALELVESGGADVLCVNRLDRLSRSVHDFAGLVARAQRRGWALVALDLGLDMTTPAGGLVANVMASVAEWERKVIGERTRAALAIRRAEGVRLGRPRETCPVLTARIRALHRRGEGLADISRILEREGLRGPRGGFLDPSAVRRLIHQAEAA